jgi:hypothetical protein
MKNQIAMTFQRVMEEAMSIMQVEDGVTAVASSSTRGPKRH